MKFVSLLVAFCFSLNVMASTGTIQELERSIDEYQYALTVDWDQKDEKFYDEQTQIFFGKMEKLIQAGLSQKEIQTFVEKRVNNNKAVEALKLKISLLAKNASSEELAQVVKEATKEIYAQGASWNGYVIFPWIAGGIVVALLAYGAWWDANHECVAYENQYVCNTYYTCNGQVIYGSPTGSSCTFPIAHTTCGYTDVCTEYQKKD
ncbi:hypothetical protein ACJVC5_18905 [Peredibacter sp. HCB2-198]|uniref:hypothetical protein n=1 Tax=Peredibacter sp. HCB2-198 TaxID=3383025 RepID=UPI0038B5E42D